MVLRLGPPGDFKILITSSWHSLLKGMSWLLVFLLCTKTVFCAERTLPTNGILTNHKPHQLPWRLKSRCYWAQIYRKSPPELRDISLLFHCVATQSAHSKGPTKTLRSTSTTSYNMTRTTGHYVSYLQIHL